MELTFGGSCGDEVCSGNWGLSKEHNEDFWLNWCPYLRSYPWIWLSTAAES